MAKTVWVACFNEPYEGSAEPGGVFRTAAHAKRLVDKHYPFDRNIFPRAGAWKKHKSGCWLRKDGWEVIPFALGEWNG